jgi:DNA-binding response OmpR family regulator
MRILLIEDDKDISRSLSLALKNEGYAVDSAEDGERGYFLAGTNDYDLLIVDYNLPKMNGRQIIETLRKEKELLPILMISVKSEISDKLDIFSSGADDYLTKPFALSELLARIRAIMRRPLTWQEDLISIGNISLDSKRFSLKKSGKEIKLSSKEFSLLEFLMRNRGRVVSRSEIMEKVWDENADPFSNTIEVHINNLRRKLDDNKKKLISTFPNRGYRLND